MNSEIELARFITRAKYQDLPQNVVKATKRDIFDTIGVGLAGTSADGIGQVVDYVREMGGKEISTIQGYGFKVPPASAALVNGAMCHARDFDDTHDAAIIHSGAVVAPAAVAAAEFIGGINGRDFINAVTLAIDLHCRLGLTSKRLLGWAYPALYGYFAAATAASKILGLNEERLLNAWGIAYSQAAGNLEMIADGGLTKRLQLGFAASAGIMAALLARKGITGSRRSFEGNMGILNLYQRGEYQPGPLTDNLGEQFMVTELSFKPYPSCRCNHGAIDAALEIVRKYHVAPEQISEVNVGVCPHDYEMAADPIDIKKKPKTTVDAQFSIPYNVACALVRKKVELDDFTEEAIKDPAVLRVAALVNPYIDVEIEKESGAKIAAARLEVRTIEGKTCKAKVLFAKGNPKNQMTDGEFAAKFRSCARFGMKGLPSKKLESLIDLLFNLEQVDDIKQVTELFAVGQ